MNLNHGSFVISLDFELMWGILDHDDPMDYEENIKNVRMVVSALLKMFKNYKIHATWGVVGLLMEDSIEQCEKNKPTLLPTYKDDKLSSYSHYKFLRSVNSDYLFAGDLVKTIQEVEGQEIATHTYSHYYCMEKGQTKKQFEADLRKAKEKAQDMDVELKTIIFPRNQFNREYDDVLKANGIISYRGNEKKWFYQSENKKKYKSLLWRGLRLLDNYAPIAGSCCYGYSELKDSEDLFNIPSSRFLRPYSRKLALFEPMRLQRIKRQMKYAAIQGKIFHLWWHPHNFGENISENMSFLQSILEYYKELNIDYGFINRNIVEIGDLINGIR